MKAKISEEIKTRSVLQLVVSATMLTFLLSGCGKQAVFYPPQEQQYPTEQQYPAEQQKQETTTVPRGYNSGPANALYKDATQAMAAGSFDQAELSLERALRIEPGNPYYWYTMGKIKYGKGANNQAVQFCLKSKSLAGRDLKLIRMNDELIEQIRRESSL
jgi:predicted Zn-dependent protease